MRFFRFICLLLILAAPGITATAQVSVRVRNPLPVDRPDEVVSLAWSDLAGRMAGLQASAVRVVAAGTREEVPSQVVDGDGDGTPDELVFLAGFWPDQDRAFVVEPHAPEVPIVARAHATHIPSRDDMAWESDRIAFRAYGQGLWENPDFDPLVSSGVDVWLKRVSDLVIDRWYERGHDAYHIDSGEGADFFSVGPTLGNGGNAVWIDETMYRAENFAAHRVVADGPVRAIFEVTYEPWMAGDVEVSQVKRVTIDAGQNLFREDVTFRFDSPGPLPYVVGFVKRAEGLVGSTRRDGGLAWMSVWGPVERKAGGHGNLGGGVVLGNSAARDFLETDDHYLVVAEARNGIPATHYVGAGWTASGDFARVEDWWNYLDAFAARVSAPLEVEIVE